MKTGANFEVHMRHMDDVFKVRNRVRNHKKAHD